MSERNFVLRVRGKIFGAWPCAVLLAAACAASAATRGRAPVAQEGRRIAPPPGVTCDLNRLTSFTGRVTYYRRTSTAISLRMRTDEETSERFTLRFRAADGATKQFLLMGEPFKAADWKLIESRRGRLRAGMRATVWVCEGGATPTVVDWRPGVRPGTVF